MDIWKDGTEGEGGGMVQAGRSTRNNLPSLTRNAGTRMTRRTHVAYLGRFVLLDALSFKLQTLITFLGAFIRLFHIVN